MRQFYSSSKNLYYEVPFYLFKTEKRSVQKIKSKEK